MQHKKKEKKIYLDKWDLVAEEKARRKLPQPREHVKLGVYHEDKIEEMLKERKRRNDYEAAV